MEMDLKFHCTLQIARLNGVENRMAMLDLYLLQNHFICGIYSIISISYGFQANHLKILSLQIALCFDFYHTFHF
jgi:hypothetical protein